MAPDPLGTIDIEALLAGMRPKLHRYCARMVGSVIDGEDVLQDALIKAMGALQSVTPVVNSEGWLSLDVSRPMIFEDDARPGSKKCSSER